MLDLLLSRFESPDAGGCGVLDEVRIERGELADYRALARFHYRGAHPGAVTAVRRAVIDQPTVVGRYLQRPSQRECVGVVVRSLPHLACQMRDLATGHRYRGVNLRESAIMLNREVRTISRVVVDPRFRGCGLAVRLVRAALEILEPGVIVIEALAAMGRVSPMFERAGMIRFDPPPRPADTRLMDAMESAGIPPVTLCSTATIISRLSRAGAATRAFVERELHRWHRDSGGRSRRGTRAAAPDNPLHEIIAHARRAVFARPVYFLSVRGDRSAC